MRLKLVIEAVRDKVNDPTAKYWSDAEVVRWINFHARQLSRHKVDADRSYGWIAHQILKGEEDRIRAEKKDVQRYYFPSWVYKIYGVRELRPDKTERGTLIDVRNHPRQSNTGYFVSTDRSIDLVGFTLPVDLEIECAKIPAALHYGTIDSPSTGRDELRFDSLPQDGASTPNTFDVSWEKDAYVGMEVEITTGATQTTNRRGTVANIISHDQVFDDNLATPAWVTRCTVFPKWPTVPQVGDTYELHVPLDESNFEYIAARVARSLFHKSRNLQGIAAVESVMAEGHNTFIAGLRPRQEQEPGFLLNSDDFDGRGFNPDKDNDLNFGF